MKKIILAVTAVIIIVLIIVLGGNKKDEGTIKIGGAFMLTGPVASLGEVQRNAVTMAVDEVNARGGIDGRQVELIIEDSAYDPRMTLNAYQSLKAKGVDYIIADGSPVVSTLREPAVKDGKLVFAVGATTPAFFDGSELSCRIALTAVNFGPGFSELLAKNNYKKVVTLLPENEYGRTLFEQFTKAYTANGGTIVASEFYDASPQGGDYRTNITKLKAKQGEVDALVMVQVGSTIESMFKQFTELSWTKPIVSDYYTIQNPSLKNVALANGIDFVDYQYSRDTSPTESEATKTFKANYAQKYGSIPVYLGAGHYDALQIIVEAIRNVGTEPQKVADYISKLKNYEGITGNLTFNDDCEVSRDLVFRTVQAGKIVDLN